MPFQSEKQRRYLWANEPEIAREWTDRYGASQGGLTRLPFWTGGFPDFFQMTPENMSQARSLPWKDALALEKQYAYNPNFKGGVSAPKYIGEGLKSLVGLGSPEIGGATPLSRKLALGAKNFLGSSVATGLPLGYAYGADKLQQSIPEELQGVMSEDIISQGAMGAGAGQDIEWDETLREEGGGLADLFSNLGIGSAEAATNVNAPFTNPNVSDPSVMQPHDFEFGDEWATGDTNKGGILDWITNKGTGLRQGLGLVNENYLMPAVAGVLGIANRYNPLSEGSQNYNKDLQGQVDMLDQMGMLGDQSSPYKITSGPLAGKNLVSAFGTNDYGRMLDKKLAYFQKRKDEDKSFSQKLWDEAQAEKDRLDREAKQRAAAAQVRSNIQRYGSGDRPDTGMNAPGGGKGQSPTGGNVSGTPFAQGGLVR